MAEESKPYDRKKPFIRIEHKIPARAADGIGHDCGTRRRADFLNRSAIDQLLRSRLMPTTPSWVPVTRKNPPPPDGGEASMERDESVVERQADREIYGRLVRSFQTWTDAPPFQWHIWYDWCFHIDPDPEYAHIRGGGNQPKAGVAIKADGDDLQFVAPGALVECEWDTGAFGKQSRAPGTTPADRCGPLFEDGCDWAWPMAGEYVWVSGRWIYDGGHELTIGGAKKTRSELHPCRAVATARWEAFKFPDQEKALPAVKFMFFTSAFGGYFNYGNNERGWLAPYHPNAGDTYEFIVDLPEMPEVTERTNPIGHTPDFPMNTLVMGGPELLIDFEFKQFNDHAHGTSAVPDPDSPPEDLKPKIEELGASDKGDRYRQVKVTIPIKAIAATNAHFYGVIVRMGWSDVDGSLAAKVKRVRVTLRNMVKSDLDREVTKEEWQLRMGVNGRWTENRWTGIGDGDDRDIDKQYEFFLHEDDEIRINAHGAEEDLVHEVYEESDGARTVVINPAEITWEDQPPNPAIPPFDVISALGDIVTGRLPSNPARWPLHMDLTPVLPSGSYAAQRVVIRRLFTMMWETFNDQNEPLGIIDPHDDLSPDRTHAPDKAKNPIKVSDIKPPGTTAKSVKESYDLTAFWTEETDDDLDPPTSGPLAGVVIGEQLMQRPPGHEDWDYKLSYDIEIFDQ